MIIAKSQLNYELIQKKIELGADAIEIQLLDEFVNFTDICEAFPDLHNCLQIPVYSIHAPLVCYANENNKLDILLEVLTKSNYMPLFTNICELANKFGLARHKIIWVVIHTAMTSLNFENEDAITMENIVNTLVNLLNKYSNIGIAIENVTPVKNFTNGRFTVSNNFLFDNVDMVLYLRKKIPQYADRFVSVLDTCHAEMAIQFISLIAKLYDNKQINIPTLEDYFTASTKTINFLHLSKTVANGIGKSRHGQPFCNNDREYIKNILQLQNKYCKSANIVLEVAETDYIKSMGFSESNRILREEIEKLRIN